MNRENRHEQQNRMKWWWILIFAGIVAAFFYILFSATMPKYTGASTPPMKLHRPIYLKNTFV